MGNKMLDRTVYTIKETIPEGQSISMQINQSQID